MSRKTVTILVSGEVGSGKSMILTEIEAALQVAGLEVQWDRGTQDRERDLISPKTMATRGIEPPLVVLKEQFT